MLFRRKLTVVGIAVLALFVVRPQAGYLRGRVSQTLRRALGREVEIRSVHLRFLPRPGFILDNVVIADDSAFGAEPLVRAPEVTAWLRLIPLLRGRIEISTLNLADASLNVTSDEQGKWNVEELIDRTARVSTAPTSARGRQARSKFPYIEATQARINLKVGREKTHFAFTNADFALWQETENAWALRLRARPIRTDANLTDTGTVLLSGLWQRSSVLSQTPLQFSMTWNQAQIGQLSKLIHGADRGWRGSAALSATVSGTPENLRLVLDAYVEDFRRAGSDTITIHVEATRHVQRLLARIRSLGAKAGVSINPGTPLAMVEDVIGDADLLLVMSVNPGFAGQSFLPIALKKLRASSTLIEAANPSCDLEVDGGVGRSNIAQVVEAGATVVVMGSSIFDAPSPDRELRALRELASSASLAKERSTI